MDKTQFRKDLFLRCIVVLLLCACLVITLLPGKFYDLFVLGAEDVQAFGEPAGQIVQSFSELSPEVRAQTVGKGTALEELNLPDTLTVVCQPIGAEAPVEGSEDTEAKSGDSDTEVQETEVKEPETEGKDMPGQDTEASDSESEAPGQDAQDPNPGFDPPEEGGSPSDSPEDGNGASEDGAAPEGDAGVPQEGPDALAPESTDAESNEPQEGQSDQDALVEETATVTIKKNFAMPVQEMTVKELSLREGQSVSEEPGSLPETENGPQAAETAGLSGEEAVIGGILWSSVPEYDGEKEGVYRFTPILPEGYVLGEGAVLPEIVVTVKGALDEVTGKKPAAGRRMEMLQEEEASDGPACGVITEDTVWGSGTLSDGTLAVMPGVTLTITDCIIISGSVVIEGGGTILRGSEHANFQVGLGEDYQINPGANLTARNIAINGASIPSEYAMIEVYQGAVTLESGCVISNCVKSEGHGAALCVAEGVATLNGPVIENCSSTEYGGAVRIRGGEMTINGGVYRNNRTTGSEYGGGFISNSNATLTILGGEFLGNSSSGKGGCIYHGGDANTVTDIQGGYFAGNTSSCPGFEGSGAIWNSAVSIGETKLIFSGDVHLQGGGAYGTDGIYLDQENGMPRKIYISDTLSYPVTMYLEPVDGYVIAEGYGGYQLLHWRDMKKIFFVDAGNSGENWYALLSEGRNQAYVTKDDPGYGYFVRYIKNGGIGPSIRDDKKYESGNAAIIKPADGLAKKGCKFIEWNTAADGTGEGYQPGQEVLITEDLDLYAIFEAGYVAATFYSGGEDEKSIQKETLAEKLEGDAAEVIAPAMKAVEGWTALGYTADPAGFDGKIKVGAEIELSEDTDYYGVYEREVELTYDAQGGNATPDGESKKRYAVSKGEMSYKNPEFTLADAPVRAGYQFMGWARKDAAGVETGRFEAGGRAEFAQDTTLYAVWEPGDDIYAVEHYWQDVEGDGYEKHETERLAGTAGETATAEPKAYVGFLENTSHPERRPSGSLPGDGSLALRLYYDRDEYEIDFDLNGAKGMAPDTQTVRYGGFLRANAPSRLGYSFKGWHKDAEGTAESRWDFDRAVEQNLDVKQATLYAKWVDDIAPVLGEASFNEGYKNVLDWIIRKKSLIITVPITEEGSGVKEAAYMLQEEGNDGNVTAATPAQGRAFVTGVVEIESKDGKTAAKITVDRDFKGKIVVSCEDNAGNVSAQKSIAAEHGGIIVEDNAPEIAFFAEEGDLNKEFLGKATINVSVKDDAKGLVSGGIASVTYRMDDGEEKMPDVDFAEGIVESCNFSVEVAEAGLHTLFVTAIDNAGNGNDAHVQVLVGMPRTYVVEHYFQDVEGNGYTKAEEEELPCDAGDEVTALAREYEGFSENLSHEERKAIGIVPDEGSLTLRLYYDRDIYEVYFDSNGSDAAPPNPQRVRYGGYLQKPSNLARAGYSFRGWHLDTEGTQESQWDFDLPVEKNIAQKTATLYANWVDDIAPALGEVSFNEGYKNVFQWIVRKKSLILSVPIVEEGSGVKQAVYTLAPERMSEVKGAATPTEVSNGTDSFVRTAELEAKEDGAIAKIAIDTDFVGKVTLFCEDKAGNVSVQKSITAAEGGIIVEDNAPEIDFSSEDGDLLDWFVDEVMVDVSVKDDVGSGISGGLASVVYQVDGKKEKAAPGADFGRGMVESHEFSVNLSGAGTHDLSVMAVDNAGNVSEGLVQIRIRKEKPKAKPKKDVPPSPREIEPVGAPITPDEPKTGEEARMRMWVSIAMAAAFFYFILYLASGYGMTREEMKRRVCALLQWTKEGGKIRRPFAVAAIFILMAFYYSFGRRESVER